MAEERLFEPINFYRTELKDKCNQEALSCFENLTNLSQIDIEANRKSCKELETKKKEKSREDSRKVAFLTLAIIFIISSIASGFCAYYYSKMGTKYIIYGILAAVLSIFLCVLFFIKRKKASQNSAKLAQKIDELLNLCTEQMRNLNSLFDYSQFLDIVQKTLPSFHFNNYTTADFASKMAENVKNTSPFHSMRDENTTIKSCLSGLIDGKMFAFLDYTKFYWGEKTYSGSLYITWTEYDTDSEGRTISVTRSQTLVAYLTKPYPMYRTDHCGLYYTQATPKLEFSRNSVGLYKMDDKKIASFVKKQTRKLEKEEKKALKDGRNFTKMSDEEFEALFNASFRNNDVEFRMMFTPYCIKNYLEMFKSKDGLGDSFMLIKSGCINLCDLDATLNRTARPQSYEVKTYSYDVTKSLFLKRCESFFRELYFTLAPFFMIPVYSHSLDEKPEDLKAGRGDAYDSFDAESITAAFPESLFRPQGTVTDIIRKSSLLGVYDFGCAYNITSTSFYSIRRLEYVPEFGGDGRMHNVPVYWDEYFPSQAEREIFVSYIGLKEAEINSLISPSVDNMTVRYKDGMLAFASNSAGSLDIERICNIIKGLGVKSAEDEDRFGLRRISRLIRAIEKNSK